MSRNTAQSILVLFAVILCSCFSSPPETSSSDSLTNEMILIPAGEFEMGQDADHSFASCQELHEPYSDTECKRSWFEDEEPIHLIYLDDYYINKYEVTNADYQVCVEDGVCDLPNKTNSHTREEYYGNPEYANYPVIYVNWYDAQTYCEWRGARLPTEAEWEKAARGIDGRIFPWGENFDGSLGNFCDREYENDDGYYDTSPVGFYPDGASPYSVMDMSGNVWEWIADWYRVDYYSFSPYENPQGPPDGNTRVYKSSPWYCDSPFVDHAADRGGVFPDFKWDMVGFRCATSVP